LSALFLDASVVVAAFDRDDGNHDAARATMTAGATLATLDLARYEVASAAIRLWQSPADLTPLLAAVDRIADDGGLVVSTNTLLRDAAEVAVSHRISIYDASYVAAAAMAGRRLISCDVRDLVSKGLAVLPGEAVNASS
jgi:predicted nucleic acid-binding protein